MKVFTWHVHGSYLYYLTQLQYDFILPFNAKRSLSYGGITAGYQWGDNVQEVPVEEVKNEEFDVIIYQQRRNYLEDKHQIFSAEQLKLPQLYLEHDPPREHPVDQLHPAAGSDVAIVHVTSFNKLMWDNASNNTYMVTHGVKLPAVYSYSGEIPRGLVIINGIEKRGRRAGFDIWQQLKDEVPLDLVGMESEKVGGLGELKHEDLQALMVQYRFLLYPMRYTSLGLVVCEAMTNGVPIVGLATTQLAETITNDENGFVSTDIHKLILYMQELLNNKELAHKLSAGAKAYATQKFGIDRFRDDWQAVLSEVVERRIN